MAEVNLGGAYVNFLARAEGLIRGVQRSRRAMRTMQMGIRRLRREMSALRRQVSLTVSGFVGFSAIRKFSSSLVEAAEQVQSVSDSAAALNVPFRQYDALSIAFQRLGESSEDVERTIVRMVGAIRLHGDKLRDIGIDTENLRSGRDVLLAYVQAWERLGEAGASFTDRLGLFTRVLGTRVAARLARISSQGSEAFESLVQDSAGLALATPDGYLEFLDRYRQFQNIVRAIQGEFVETYGPQINEFLDGFAVAGRLLVQHFSEAWDYTKRILSGIATIIAYYQFIGSGASIGGGIGSVFGPKGAGVGAVVGAGVGAVAANITIDKLVEGRDKILETIEEGIREQTERLSIDDEDINSAIEGLERTVRQTTGTLNEFEQRRQALKDLLDAEQEDYLHNQSRERRLRISETRDSLDEVEGYIERQNEILDQAQSDLIALRQRRESIQALGAGDVTDATDRSESPLVSGLSGSRGRIEELRAWEAEQRAAFERHREELLRIADLRAWELEQSKEFLAHRNRARIEDLRAWEDEQRAAFERYQALQQEVAVISEGLGRPLAIAFSDNLRTGIDGLIDGWDGAALAIVESWRTAAEQMRNTMIENLVTEPLAAFFEGFFDPAAEAMRSLGEQARTALGSVGSDLGSGFFSDFLGIGTNAVAGAAAGPAIGNVNVSVQGSDAATVARAVPGITEGITQAVKASASPRHGFGNRLR